MKFLFFALLLLSNTVALSQQLITSPTVKQLAAGTNHSVALLIDGTIWAWGKNSSGQLGDSSTKDRYTPVKIGTDINWSSITAGNNFSHGIKKDGSLWGWGTNKVGQLGISTANLKYDYWSPVQIGTDNDCNSVYYVIYFNIVFIYDFNLCCW